MAELSMNVIIIAAIALLVLAILAVLLINTADSPEVIVDGEIDSQGCLVQEQKHTFTGCESTVIKCEKYTLQIFDKECGG